MINIPIEAVPNQQFSARLGSHRFVIRLKEANGVMAADVSIDGAVRLRGQRIVAGTPLIPYLYLEEGNLILLTLNEALPDWRQFSVTQTLVYLSAQEIAALA